MTLFEWNERVCAEVRTKEDADQLIEEAKQDNDLTLDDERSIAEMAYMVASSYLPADEEEEE